MCSSQESPEATTTLSMHKDRLRMSVSSRRRPLAPSSSNMSSPSLPDPSKKYAPKEHNSALQRWARPRRIAFSCFLVTGVVFFSSYTITTKHATAKDLPHPHLHHQMRRNKKGPQVHRGPHVHRSKEGSSASSTKTDFQPTVESKMKMDDPPKRTSLKTESKPLVVGYMDIHVGAPSEKRDMLKSKYRTVIRINPENYEVIPTESSRSINQTKPLWSRSIRNFVDPMSDTIQTYDDKKEKALDNKDCQLPHKWMNKSFPTCNNLHGQGMMEQLLDPNRLHPKFLIGQGSMRSVWILEQNVNYNAPIEMAVLKTLNMERSFSADNLDRHRRDALISERLTSSPHFLDIYAYCGYSSMYQYAASGSLFDVIGAREWSDMPNDEVAHDKWEKWSNQHKFDVSYQVASAVSDLHNIDHNGRPSVAHDDLDITQFVSTDGGKTFKLSDFNGSPFLKWNTKTNETCAFEPLMNGGKTRSPEEYNGDWITEKSDVFALGNVLYTIVAGEYPFRHLSTDATENRVRTGILPIIPDHIRRDSDPTIQALINVMQLCWKRDPKKRASSAKIKRYLQDHMEKAKKSEQHPNLKTK